MYVYKICTRSRYLPSFIVTYESYHVVINVPIHFLQSIVISFVSRYLRGVVRQHFRVY